MQRLIQLGRAAALLSSPLLLGLYVYDRSGGNVFAPHLAPTADAASLEVISVAPAEASRMLPLNRPEDRFPYEDYTGPYPLPPKPLPMDLGRREPYVVNLSTKVGVLNLTEPPPPPPPRLRGVLLKHQQSPGNLLQTQTEAIVQTLSPTPPPEMSFQTVFGRSAVVSPAKVVVDDNHDPFAATKSGGQMPADFGSHTESANLGSPSERNHVHGIHYLSYQSLLPSLTSNTPSRPTVWALTSKAGSLTPPLSILDFDWVPWKFDRNERLSLSSTLTSGVSPAPKPASSPLKSRPFPIQSSPREPPRSYPYAIDKVPPLPTDP